MATESSQRNYRALCPGCGAPLSFLSAQSTHAVCGYCQSTVVRDGDVLSRIGKMAELFEDFSPLQLFANGKFNGKAFTLIGRLQYKYELGRWTEWIASFEDGSTAYLSEDNGAFVLSMPLQSQIPVSPADHYKVGKTTAINGKSFAVTSNSSVALVSAQGELPKLPPLNAVFSMVELRGDQGDVLSIDYGAQDAAGSPALTLGRAVLLEDLKLTGLKDEHAKLEKGQSFECPNCAAPIKITLGSTKSLTCANCNSIIDVSQGLAGQLHHALQTDPVAPLIPLGSTGMLQGVTWQVVGFQHRMGYEADDPDEHFGWTEYVLYNNKRGFSFLVDSTEGWSMATPTTGAPSVAFGGKIVTYLGTKYVHKYSYKAQTNYVAGEFYWHVERGQTTHNSDFENKGVLLSREEAPNEVTWSLGSKLNSMAIEKAFKLQAGALGGDGGGNSGFDLSKLKDVAPANSVAGVGCGTIVVLIVVLLLLLTLISRCSGCDPNVENCSSTRGGGGSFGGYSSGGGHK